MRPWRAIHKLLEKFPGRDGPRLAIGGGIAQIAHVTLHRFEIFRIHRQRPETLTAITSLRGNGVTERLVIAEQCNADVTQRNAYCTGERGGIDDVRGAEPRGIGQGIGQHQPALGIGVDDLDGLAVHGGDDVTRTRSRAAGHVFRHGQQTGDAQGWLQTTNRGNSAQHGGGSAHVVFHFLHRVGGLE